MADSAVSFLLQNLPRLLNDELKLLSGVEDKINSLCKELRFIDIFLKSSNQKRDNKFVKEVVNQIRDVSFQAEDMIDTYVVKVAIQRRRRKVSKLFHWKAHVLLLHHVDAEIDTIRKRIDEIYKNKEKYGIIEGESTSEDAAAVVESIRDRRRDVEEKEVVGLVHDSTQVIEKLIRSDLRRRVVSIIGMGGLGKTTLARKIYNHRHVKELFPIRAWGYVSDDYRPKELWLTILNCFLSKSEYDDLFKRKPGEDEANAANEEKLKSKVREYLKGKKYLVVLDDIWKVEVWNKIEDAFPDENNGSRILITSREMDVVNYAGQGTTSPYYLPLLDEEQSWQLFFNKVFPEGQHCPSYLEPHGRSMARSCKGLPLAIVVLAGLVARKERSERVWLRMKNITWHLSQDKNQVTDILKLSYDSLPQRLKPCFLYFGIYPEDYEISVEELMRLWIAEGFIEAPEGAEEEDIAEYYLDELVDCSLVQVASRRSIDGGVKTCRIHDLLRDLCILESKSDRFLDVHTKSDDTHTPTNAPPRRLSFHCNVSSPISTNKFNQCTRSLFFFSQQEKISVDLLKFFNLPRVIHSSCQPLLIDWNMMIHLRYLRIENVEVPDTVGLLWNLETLHVSEALMISAEIWKLKRLKHLSVFVGRGGSGTERIIGERLAASLHIPKSPGEIKGNLQTLATDHQGIMSLLNNHKFPSLRNIVLVNHHWLGLQLHHLSSLHSLTINTYAEVYKTVFPSNLINITFKDKSYLSSRETVKILAQLPNLQCLKLSRFSSSVNFNFGAGEFQKLRVLHMKAMFIRRWTLEEGAMPCLQNLLIRNCQWLNELPQQLWSLTTLQKVLVERPAKELAENLKNVELKNRCKLIVS